MQFFVFYKTEGIELLFMQFFCVLFLEEEGEWEEEYLRIHCSLLLSAFPPFLEASSVNRQLRRLEEVVSFPPQFHTPVTLYTVHLSYSCVSTM